MNYEYRRVGDQCAGKVPHGRHDYRYTARKLAR